MRARDLVEHRALVLEVEAVGDEGEEVGARAARSTASTGHAGRRVIGRSRARGAGATAAAPRRGAGARPQAVSSVPPTAAAAVVPAEPRGPGERAGGEAPPEALVAEHARERAGERVRVAGRDEEPRLSVADRIAEAGHGGRHARRAARVRLDHGEAPALLLGGLHGDVGGLEEAHLLRLVDEARHVDACLETERAHLRPHGVEGVARARDDRVHVEALPAHLGHGREEHVEPLVALEPADEDDQRARIPPRRVGTVARMIDAAVDDADRRRGDAARDHVVAGALGDRDEGGPAVDARHQPLGTDDQRGDRGRHLLERRRAEEVVDDRDEREPRVERRHERQLVERLDEHVGPLARRCTRGTPARRACSSRSGSGRGGGRGRRAMVSSGAPPGEAGAEHRHAVAGGREPAEDLEEVDLGAARARVVEIALVQDEDVASHGSPAQSRPKRCATRRYQAIHRASRLMRFVIFESPTVRSMKMIGISWIRKPRRQARYVISIWKA